MTPQLRASSGSCPKCGGTGKIRYRILGDALPTDLGNGVTIQNMGGDKRDEAAFASVDSAPGRLPDRPKSADR